MQVGGGGGGAGRGGGRKPFHACLHTQLRLLKGLREVGGGGGGLFHTCPHTQLLHRLKGNSLDSLLLPTILSTFKNSTLFEC